MSAETAYDPNNIFAKILRGEMPAHEIYEDDETLAFMDIMPRGDGHMLVLPRTPCRNLLDAPPEALAAVMRTAQVVARAGMAALGADGATVQQFNEPAGGQVVFHLHVHVIPRFEGVPLRPHSGEMADQARLAEIAARIKKHIQST